MSKEISIPQRFLTEIGVRFLQMNRTSVGLGIKGVKSKRRSILIYRHRCNYVTVSPLDSVTEFCLYTNILVLQSLNKSHCSLKGNSLILNHSYRHLSPLKSQLDKVKIKISRKSLNIKIEVRLVNKSEI